MYLLFVTMLAMHFHGLTIFCAHVQFIIMVSDCSVHYQYVSWDHKPISITLKHLQPKSVTLAASISNVGSIHKVLPDWSKCDASSVAFYQYELDLALTRISTPSVLFDASADCDNVLICDKLIDKYYNDISFCVNGASFKCIAGRQFNGSFSEHVVPGWNDYDADKHLEWHIWIGWQLTNHARGC